MGRQYDDVQGMERKQQDLLRTSIVLCACGRGIMLGAKFLYPAPQPH